MWRCDKCETINNDTDDVCFLCHTQRKIPKKYVIEKNIEFLGTKEEIARKLGVYYTEELSKKLDMGEVNNTYIPQNTDNNKKNKSQLFKLTALGIAAICILIILIYLF